MIPEIVVIALSAALLPGLLKCLSLSMHILHGVMNQNKPQPPTHHSPLTYPYGP